MSPREWLKKHFPFIDENVDRIGYWSGFIVLVWTVMSAIVSSIPSVSQYGWGAVVLVGLGVACILALVMSVCLVAWRYFNPLGPVEGRKVKTETTNTGQFATLVDRIDRLDADLQKRLHAGSQATLALQAMLGNLGDKTERLGNDLAQLRSRTESDISFAKDSSLIISRSLRARDAESIISKGDTIKPNKKDCP